MACTAEKEYFCSHVPSLLQIFILSWQSWRSIIEKKKKKNELWEERRRTLMCRWRPTKSSIERTAGFVVMLKAQSASWVAKQRLLKKVVVWDTQHVGAAFCSKSFTTVPCQILDNYELAIPNSMTLGTGKKWSYQHDIIPSGQNTPRVYSPWPNGTWRLCLFSHILRLSEINYWKIFFSH